MASVCKMYPERLPEKVRREPKLWAEVEMYDALARCMGFGWVVFYDVAWLGRVGQFDAPRDGQTDYDETESEYELSLTRPIQPGADHAVVWWSPGYAPILLVGPEIRVGDSDRQWRITCPLPERARCSAIGIACCGEWLGVGWSPRAVPSGWPVGP